MARFVHPHFQKSRDLLRGSYAYATSRHEEFTGQAGAAIQAEIDRHAARRAAEPKRTAAENDARMLSCADRNSGMQVSVQLDRARAEARAEFAARFAATSLRP